MKVGNTLVKPWCEFNFFYSCYLFLLKKNVYCHLYVQVSRHLTGTLMCWEISEKRRPARHKLTFTADNFVQPSRSYDTGLHTKRDQATTERTPDDQANRIKRSLYPNLWIHGPNFDPDFYPFISIFPKRLVKSTRLFETTMQSKVEAEWLIDNPNV